MGLFSLFSIFFLFVTMVSCTVTTISHDEELAAAAAVNFAQTAFVRKDFRSAYALLAENMKRNVNFEDFQKITQRMHPMSFPATVRATEFEPMPGQKAMNIFLVGENGSEQFYYRLTMEGTTQTNYRVVGMYRGNGPYPPSNWRQVLKVKSEKRRQVLNRDYS